MGDIRALLLEICDDQKALITRLDNLESQVRTSNKDVKQRIAQLGRKLLHGAVHEVFRLPELVEQILVHLDIRDLLRIQPQSQFKTVINSSLALQRKLYLVPETRDSAARPELNPLLFDPRPVRQTNAFFNKLKPAHIEKIARGWERSHSIILRIEGKVHDHKRRSDRILGITPIRLDVAVVEDNDEVHFELRQPRLSNAPQEELAEDGTQDGSWRKMLLVQPPREIHWVAVDLPRASGTIRAGTTMEDLIEEGTSQTFR